MQLVNKKTAVNIENVSLRCCNEVDNIVCSFFHGEEEMSPTLQSDRFVIGSSTSSWLDHPDRQIDCGLCRTSVVLTRTRWKRVMLWDADKLYPSKR